MKDLQSGKYSALSDAMVDEYHPVITMDGSRVAYHTVAQNRSDLYVLTIDAKGDARPAEKICDGCFLPWDWSPDANRILYWSDQLRSIGAIDLASRSKQDILHHAQDALLRSHYSPDGRWLAVQGIVSPGASRVFLVPVRNGTAAPPAEWTTLLDEGDYENATWSETGDAIYFASERDGFRCLWGQRLEPATKRRSGDLFPLRHFHNAHRSLTDLPLQYLEIAVGADKIVFPLKERTGNIWMASYR